MFMCARVSFMSGLWGGGGGARKGGCSKIQ